MTPKERLQSIEQQLVARGVTDIKFAWGNISQKPLSQVTTEVCDVLQAYLDGKYHPLPAFNDAVLPKLNYTNEY